MKEELIMPPSSPSSSPSPSPNNVLPTLHHALSGSLGILISICSLYPLSLVIARLQVQRQVQRRRRRREGGRRERAQEADPGLGHPGRGPSDPPIPTTLAHTSPPHGDHPLPSEKVCTQQAPVRNRDRQLRQPTAEYAGIVDAFSQIWSSDGDGGLRAFYTGLAQDGTLLGPNGALGVREIVRSIRKEKGITGFWSGYSASLVLTLNPSLTLFLQQFLKPTFAEQTYDDLGSGLTFPFAANSEAISSFVTYPFQIAKTRLQAGIRLGSGESDEKQLSGTNEVKSKPDKHAEDDRDGAYENKLGRICAMQKLASEAYSVR
ncbi:hypothetical protein E0Z10_g4087 [Xylaria hypoxylon]|uniref:Uncharacterized protein n=1 Tax=Xylaria hypoxylon TaxID=37992 RepID=A0A4Z0Z559_9PEZI|nr:hypothetical protein E0Z10_g4087 [Xylaria hypoxylon]